MAALAVDYLDSPVSEPISFSRRIPISIQIKDANGKQNFIRNNSYSLKLQNFNPDKMSPPNHWKNRIEKRLNNYF